MKPDMNPEQDIAKTLNMGHETPRLRKMKSLIIAALLILAAIAAFLIVRGTGKSEQVKYKTEEARYGDLTVTVTATGTLQPKNSVDVGSELSGIIKSVEVTYNSTVKAGQALARLDTTKLMATIAQSEASLASAKAKVLQAEATVKETKAKLAQYRNVRKLSDGKVPSQLEMDGAEAGFERANADLAYCVAAVSQAEAILQANKTDLSKSVIRSPFNGVVLSRSVEPGQTVAASLQVATLFTLAEDLTQMDLQLNVDEADIGKIQVGQKATFTVSAYPNRTFEARIIQARYGSTTTSGVVTYKTVLRVNNSDLSLRPGMTATADITVRKLERVLLIPSAALRFSPPVRQDAKPQRSLMESLIPHPPKQATRDSKEGAPGKERRVWILKDNELLGASVSTGATNGSMTEVLANGIKPGTPVVTDTIRGVK